MQIGRRELLKGLLLLIAARQLRFIGQEARAQSRLGRSLPDLTVAQLRYRGGDWDPHRNAVRPLMEELQERTSVTPAMERQVLTLRDRNLFAHPFLYLTGRQTFEPFDRLEVETLRRFLLHGGFLLIDNAAGYQNGGFEQTVRAQMARVFPERGWQRLSPEHPIFKAFYLIRMVGGRRLVSPYLEGIEVEDWTPVVYCPNDLGGAYDRDPQGQWRNECVPGGEPQRLEAFKLGVNLILYALTENYKGDSIHAPFIKRRLG